MKASQMRLELQEWARPPRHGGASRLETHAVAAPTRKTHEKTLSEFDAYCKLERLRVADVRSLETALLEYFEHRYLDGHKVNYGTL